MSRERQCRITVTVTAIWPFKFPISSTLGGQDQGKTLVEILEMEQDQKHSR